MTLSLGLALVPSALPPGGEPSLMSLSRVAADGWTATYPDPPAGFDPMGDPEVVTVARPGFDATGTPVTVEDAVTVMARLRRPYPDQAELTPDTVVLSDFIHAGDIVAGVANASARPHPLPVCAWLIPDSRIATGSVTLRLAVAHMYARAGRPVAAVRFSITDGVTTQSGTVSAMSTQTYGASGRTVPHFAHAFDLSGFADGAELTADATIFPWVGAAFGADVDGTPYPSINFTTLRLFKAPAQRAVACVDPSAGDDATGLASPDEATAAASPFRTLQSAVAAITGWNTANLGQADAGGGIVVLEDGVTPMTPFRSQAGGTLGLPLTIRGRSRAGAIFEDDGTNRLSGVPSDVRFEGLTLRRSSAGNVVFLDNGAGQGSAQMMTFSGVDFDDGGHGGFYGGWLYRTGRLHFEDCTTPGVLGAPLGPVNKMPRVIGCAGPFGPAYALIGSTGAGTNTNTLDGNGREQAEGTFIGWNLMSHPLTTAAQIKLTQPVGPRGLALVGNVVEDVDGATSPALWINADGSDAAAENVVVQLNTVVGQRANILYNDSGSAVKSGSFRFNVFQSLNTKSDIFAGSGANVGNWPAIFHVGYRANAYIDGGDDGSVTFGRGNWVGEVGEAGAAIGSRPDWPDDASGAGSGAGQGDYRPGPGNDLPRIPPGLAPYPCDQAGAPLADDGTAPVGARAVP